MDYATILFCLYLLFIVTSATTTFLHEVGHAIPSLIFTKEKVSIYLGTYGDDEKSRKINLSNRLAIHFLLNPLTWRRGMVRSNTSSLKLSKQFTVILLGPLMSLIIAGIALWITFSFNLHGSLKVFAMVLSISALIDLRNIYPSKKAIILADGSQTYCDGYQLLRLLKSRKEKADYFAACDLYEAQNYREAIKLFEKVRDEWISPDMLSVVIRAYSELGEYKMAKAFYSRFIYQLDFILDSDLSCNIGYTLSQLNEHEQAMDFYNRSIALNENNIFSICNRGFTYNVFEQYPEALADFDRVLTINAEFSYGYSNRAFTHLMMKMTDKALADIDTAIRLDDKNAYAYRNLGIYYLELGDYIKAMEQLQVAFKIDPLTHMIDQYIKIAGDKLAGSPNH